MSNEKIKLPQSTITLLDTHHEMTIKYLRVLRPAMVEQTNTVHAELLATMTPVAAVDELELLEAIAAEQFLSEFYQLSHDRAEVMHGLLVKEGLQATAADYLRDAAVQHNLLLAENHVITDRIADLAV